MHTRNLLDDPTVRIGDIEFADAAADTVRQIWYDFGAREADCPLLLNAPRNLKIEALIRAEEEEKARKGRKAVAPASRQVSRETATAGRRASLGGAPAAARPALVPPQSSTASVAS